MPGFLPPHHFELIATHWQGLSMGCLFPALPRSSLPAKKLEGLLRYIEGCGSETLLKTIFCLYSLSSTTPDNSRLLFQFLCELFWACLFLLVIWVKPRMTQLDDPHLRPSQTLLLGLERAKEKLPLQSTQDEVPAQPWVFFSVDLSPGPWTHKMWLMLRDTSPPALLDQVTNYFQCSLVPWRFQSTSRYGMNNLYTLFKLLSSTNALFKAQKKNTPTEVQRSQT